MTDRIHPAEKPILFSAPMVRALLAGLKTQTRRVITGTRGGDMALAIPLAEPVRIDILYRMLSVRELARAMSFEVDGIAYPFKGTATDITKQIGNAIPVRTAQALVSALLDPAGIASLERAA